MLDIAQIENVTYVTERQPALIKRVVAPFLSPFRDHKRKYFIVQMKDGTLKKVIANDLINRWIEHQRDQEKRQAEALPGVTEEGGS